VWLCARSVAFWSAAHTKYHEKDKSLKSIFGTTGGSALVVACTSLLVSCRDVHVNVRTPWSLSSRARCGLCVCESVAVLKKCCLERRRVGLMQNTNTVCCGVRDRVCRDGMATELVKRSQL
jgi:hypothetical protein